MKTCIVCRETLPLEAFCRDRSRHDGHSYRCKPCAKTYRRKYSRYSVSVDVRKCPDCGESKSAEMFYRCTWEASGLSIYCKACHSKHGRDRYQQTKEAVLKRCKTWRQANPEKQAEYRHRRRALVLNCQYEDYNPLDIFKDCVYCGGQDSLEVEHLIPLSRGGDHTKENLAVACRSCNASKNSKTPLEWLCLA